jgi:hypothetical protein
MLKEGAYHGYLKGCQIGETKGGENVQFVLTFAVSFIAGANGAWDDIAPVNRTVYLSCSDGAWPYTEKKLKALEFNGNFAEPAFSEDAAKRGVGLVCRTRNLLKGRRGRSGTWPIGGRPK